MIANGIVMMTRNDSHKQLALALAKKENIANL
jgi:hypothetical protein